MRIFAFEFFSGGGLAGLPLPETLAREGDLMLATLVADLAELPGITVLAGRDPRLPPLPACETLRPRPGEGPSALYARGLAASDAAWPTAPESGGILERLCRETTDAGRLLLGCRPDAVHLTASKRATALALRTRGIPAVPTFALGELPAPTGGPWVVKPDDGAGCEDTEVVPGFAAVEARLAREPGRLVAQPWVEGEPLSLSLLCRDGTAGLLSCNRQRTAVRHGRLSLESVLVNAVADAGGRYAALGERIAAAIPGLWGYVGVDLVETTDGPVVLEVNPRLTTSYCGLRTALGINPAALVLDLLQAPGRRLHLHPSVAGATAEIRLAHADAG
jgi:predicted ATP-grasp superfamily ATP-dependent carboligase